MTKDEIISMVREAGLTERNHHSEMIVRHSNGSWVDVEHVLTRFARLVAAAEREACADILDRNCDKCDPHSIAYEVLDSNAKAIRARSQQ